MPVYTATGDSGHTSLADGSRAAKDHIRIHAYGTLDECNAVLGLVRVKTEDSSIGQALAAIQEALFLAGGELATPDASPAITTDHIAQLEQLIDRAEDSLPKLSSFILPGGTETAARLHLARTVVRRAERHMVTLHRQEPLNPALLAWVNRLGDLLFVWARLANQQAGRQDIVVGNGVIQD